MTTEQPAPRIGTEELSDLVAARISEGCRFCGLFASAAGTATRLLAVLDDKGSLAVVEAVVPPGVDQFASLTPRVPAAAWYEREIQDLFGLEPRGHPRTDPLLLPVPKGSERPRPGSGTRLGPLALDLGPLPSHVSGEGVFTIPYGPVRSGVFESIEYLVETSGEDIPHVRTRVFHKHRGVECRFEGMTIEDGTLLAERCEGVASVAHAVAYCEAVERAVRAVLPVCAQLVRVMHAELERVSNHLDSVIRHTEAAGQAVANSRLSLHKERVQRLRAQLCGNRFGRGVVVPGGVASGPPLGGAHLLPALTKLERAIRNDVDLLMITPSFLDRLRGTGVLTADSASQAFALGPVGRGSGQANDVRFTRPYAAYDRLGRTLLEPRSEGDALARQWVRLEEIRGSFHLIRQAVDELDELQANGQTTWRVPLDRTCGEALGWAEAPQGEVLYLVQFEHGRLVRVKPRSASFHNLALFTFAFPKDVLTDFAFIEASFGLSIAGVVN